MMNQFFSHKLTCDNLDNFHIRKSIFGALKECGTVLKGGLLDVGCGQMPYKQYILESTEVDKYVGIDIYDAIEYDKDVKPDVQWDGGKLPFDDASFDSILLTEVLEHSPTPQMLLDEVSRVLRPGGAVVFTVPYLWPLHETPHDEYRYTPYALQRLFSQAHFSEVEITSGGGWHASLAQMLGLWARRAPLRPWQRTIASYVLFPVVKLLLYKDQKIDRSFKEQQMMTNLYGFAKK